MVETDEQKKKLRTKLLKLAENAILLFSSFIIVIIDK